jgi:epoxyqueuosine reductase
VKIPQDLVDKFQIVDWSYTDQLEANTFDKFEKWIEQGHAGPLQYLKDDRKEKRRSLKHYKNEIQSALVFLFSYAPTSKAMQDLDKKQEVASYALSCNCEDYHHFLKNALEELSVFFGTQGFSNQTFWSLDTQPVLERDLAHRAGLGWFGKNSMLISRVHGSYFFIGALYFDQQLNIESRSIDTDHCGHCRKCIDACPTDAIIEDQRQIEAQKCISTFTIETFKDATPPEGYEGSSEVFGCDICQQVCPWNIKAFETLEWRDDLSAPKQSMILDYFVTREKELVIEDLNQLSNRSYKKKFISTSLARTGRMGLLKNLKRKN